MDFLGGGIVMVLMLILAGIWLWALYDVAMYPEEAWRTVRESKGLWLVIVLAFQFFGTLAYFLVVRPKLLRITDYSKTRQLAG